MCVLEVAREWVQAPVCAKARGGLLTLSLLFPRERISLGTWGEVGSLPVSGPCPIALGLQALHTRLFTYVLGYKLRSSHSCSTCSQSLSYLPIPTHIVLLRQNLITLPMLTGNLPSSCLSFIIVGITGEHHKHRYTPYPLVSWQQDSYLTPIILHLPA